jgi:hypothetical protein
MKSTFLWALIVLNVMLLIGVIGRFSRPNAAVAQAVRRPGEYIMIPGEVTGGNAGVVYILDTTNGLLSALTLQPGNERLVNMPKIDLAQIFARGADAVEKGGNNKTTPKR